jgi:amidase
MEITKAKLLAAGHKVIDFVPFETKEASEIIGKMWTADGGEEIRRDAGATGEPLPVNAEKYYGPSNKSLKPSTVFETWQNQYKKTLLAQSLLERWQKTAEETGTGRPIDALITPSTPFPAVRHDQPYKWNYGTLSPLLDLTTGIFPVTKVDLEKDVIPADWQPISEKDKEVMEFCKFPLLAFASLGLRYFYIIANIRQKMRNPKIMKTRSLASH